MASKTASRISEEGQQQSSYLQEVVDDVADLGLGEAVLGEVVSGGVDPPFSSLGPRPPHRRLGRCTARHVSELPAIPWISSSVSAPSPTSRYPTRSPCSSGNFISLT
jgi:hypothetical protein